MLSPSEVSKKVVTATEDLSDGNHVDINVQYPKNCNCEASIRFEVKVPRNLNLNYDAISSVSGDVEIDGARGTLHVKAVSGDVRIINAKARFVPIL